MLLVFEWLVIFLLLMAGGTGVLALSSLSAKARKYKIRKLFSSKEAFFLNKDLRRFLVYLVITLSTVSAFLAAYLRLVWLRNVGWDSVGEDWASWWLTSHGLDAVAFTALHLLVYMNNKRHSFLKNA